MELYVQMHMEILLYLEHGRPRHQKGETRDVESPRELHG